MVRGALAGLCAVVCALGQATVADAIVGGHAASREYPAMAALEFKGAFQCGASLVRPTWILTAAHCVADGEAVAKPEDLSFVLGRPRRSDETVGERLKAITVIRHESYAKPTSASNDIALVELERAAKEAPIRVVTASEGDRWKAGTTATVIGWGSQSALGIDGGSDDLSEVDVPIQPDSTCDQTYRNTLGYDAATMLCAGNGLGGKDSCQGDSGGPMMVLADGAPLLVGVVSFGLGCGFPTQYGVYARIGAPALADWIVRHAGPVAAPTGPATPATPVAPLAASKVIGLRKATKRGRTLRLSLSVRRPVTGLRISISRLRGARAVALTRTTRTQARRSFTALLRLPSTARPGRLRVKVTARDADGRAVGFTRTLRTRG
jgi:secreted trypsin-like serine protease